MERDPEYVDAWACLAILYLDEHRNHFNPRLDPLDRALEAARRAVERDPTGSLAHDALARAHFYRRELDAFLPAAERAVRLNPNDCTTVAMMGLLTAYAGRWEARGSGGAGAGAGRAPKGWPGTPVGWGGRHRGGAVGGAVRLPLRPAR